MSFAVPTQTDLFDRFTTAFTAKLQGADAQMRRSFLNTLSKVLAEAMRSLYGAQQEAAEFLPDRCVEDILLRWCSIFDVPRKDAVASSGNITITGTNGTVIPAGTVLTRADGKRYATQGAVTIALGTASPVARAEDPGIAGDMDAGQLLTFLSPIAGASATATVTAGIAGGADLELIDDLRARLLARIRNPPSGGTKKDYERWATEVAGVTRAWCEENWNGLGTVRVLFVFDGRPDIIPTVGDVSAVNTYIQARRPVCADVTVAAPTGSAQLFTIHIAPDTPEIRAAVTAELDDLFARESAPGGTLLLTHIHEAISIAAGESDHTLTTPSADVVAAAGTIKTRGTITWS